MTNYLVYKISQRGKPNLRELLAGRRFDLIVNIPTGKRTVNEITDGKIIRQKSIETDTKLLTNVEVAKHLINRLYQRKFGNLN